MIRKILLGVLVALLACSVAYAEAKPVLMVLSTKTCPACREMKKVLTQLNKKYPGIETQNIYLETKEGAMYGEMYEVEYVPTLVFKDASGEDFDMRVGYMSVEKIAKIFKNAGVKIN